LVSQNLNHGIYQHHHPINWFRRHVKNIKLSAKLEQVKAERTVKSEKMYEAWQRANEAETVAETAATENRRKAADHPVSPSNGPWSSKRLGQETAKAEESKCLKSKPRTGGKGHRC
jgi:hypothetical protein